MRGEQVIATQRIVVETATASGTGELEAIALDPVDEKVLKASRRVRPT